MTSNPARFGRFDSGTGAYTKKARLAGRAGVRKRASESDRGRLTCKCGCGVYVSQNFARREHPTAAAAGKQKTAGGIRFPQWHGPKTPTVHPTDGSPEAGDRDGGPRAATKCGSSP
jgi:hypothetical protein